MLSRAADRTRLPGQRGLVGNAGQLLTNRVLQGALGWGGTVLIAQSLTVEQFGHFTLIFTVLGMMSIVTDMGIGRLALQGMLKHPDPTHFAGAYLALRSVLGVVGYLTALGVLFLGGYSRDLLLATAVAGIVVLLATPNAALSVVFQAHQRIGLTGRMTTAGLLAQLALTAAIAAAGGTVLLFTIPAVLAITVELTWKLRASRHLVPLALRWDTSLWGHLLREAVPLSIGYGLLTLYTRVDALMLSQLATFRDVGIYGVAYKFIDIMHFASSAVTAAALAVLVASWPGDLPAFQQAVRRSAMLLGLTGGAVLTGLLAFAGPATSLLYGSAYAAGADALRVLAVAEMLVFATGLALTCLVATNRHRTYPWVMLTGLVLNVGANLVLIPAWGYFGAAVATLLSNAVVATWMWVLIWRLPGARPAGLGRLVVVALAVALGSGTGLAADLVLPWIPAAVAALAVYLGVVTALGVTTAAGVRLPRPKRPAGADA